ncbi:MAG: Bax inhibitor-1/YccA family protein [Methanimicrococcus sp.]|nr:Bax inhibitor-1/YccA family protein [Methanimicrococcus sp.]
MSYSENSGNQFLSKVYLWMFIGLLLTAVASFGVLSSPSLMSFFIESGLFYILIFVELAIVILLSWRIKSMSSSTATLAFIFYSVISGITLTPILFFYTESSIFLVFLTTSGMFIGMSLFGYFTKKDLSGIGRFLIMALIGLVIAMILNIILYMIAPETAILVSFGLSVVAVLIFAGLTAYDTQNIKKIGQTIDHNDPFAQNLAIIGALKLYLDFVNLFIHLLKLFGKRR